MILQKTKKKAGQLVGKAHVDQLVNAYREKRWLENTRRLGKPDSRSAWFDMEAFHQFMDLAKEQNADGMKIYYGVYPEDYSKPEYRGLQTVVLVATKEKMTADGEFNSKDIYVVRDGKPEILAFNQTNICPPTCGTEPPPGGAPDPDGGWYTVFRNNGLPIN